MRYDKERMVYKFELQKKPGRQSLVLPKNARFLSLAEQEGHLFAYYLIDPEEQRSEDVMFTVAWTGRSIMVDPYDKFLGTVQVGRYVFHVFSDVRVVESNG